MLLRQGGWIGGQLSKVVDSPCVAPDGCGSHGPDKAGFATDPTIRSTTSRDKLEAPAHKFRLRPLLAGSIILANDLGLQGGCWRWPTT